MNVKKNLNFILLLISFGSLPFLLVSSGRVPSKKQKNSTEALQPRSDAWYFTPGAHGLTADEFIMQNARVWLAEKSVVLQENIATVDIDKLAAGIKSKSIDADMIDRQTESIFFWLQQAHTDEKLLQNLQYNSRHDRSRQDHQKSCLDAICCGVHQQGHEGASSKSALEALGRCQNAKKLAEKILNERAKGATITRSYACSNSQFKNVRSLCYCILFVLECDIACKISCA